MYTDAHTRSHNQRQTTSDEVTHIYEGDILEDDSDVRNSRLTRGLAGTEGGTIAALCEFLRAHNRVLLRRLRDQTTYTE